jgi:Ca-activated chloride channel family protein
VSISRYPLWRYSLFQVPLGGFILCLIIALLSFLLGWGRPSLAMAIALDLSSSTYTSNLFEVGSISAAWLTDKTNLRHRHMCVF